MWSGVLCCGVVWWGVAWWGAVQCVAVQFSALCCGVLPENGTKCLVQCRGSMSVQPSLFHFESSYVRPTPAFSPRHLRTVRPSSAGQWRLVLQVITRPISTAQQE